MSTNNSVTFLFIENPSTHTTGGCPVNRGYIKATPSSETLPFTTSDSISINISGNVPTTQRNFVYISWYFNGYSSLPSGTSRSNLLRLPTGISQTLKINNPRALHNGTYEALLLMNTWSYSYFQQFVCPSDYWYFVYYSSRAGVYETILDQISFNLQYYGELILRANLYIAILCSTIPIFLQNHLQFPFSQLNHLFRTMSIPLSIAQLMVATLLPVAFHSSRMVESSPRLVLTSL